MRPTGFMVKMKEVDYKFLLHGKIPDWVGKFNNSNKIKSYLKEWDTFYPIETYTESAADLNNYENSFISKQNAVFPMI